MCHMHYALHASCVTDLCITRIMRHMHYVTHLFVAIKDSIYLLSITSIIHHIHCAKFSAALEPYTKIYAALRPVHVVHP